MKGKDICFICRAGSPSTCHPALLWKYVVDITLVVDKINHVVYQIYNIAKKIHNVVNEINNIVDKCQNR